MSTTDVVTMDKIVSLCKRRGFVFPSSEIYGGLGSSYDYGHYGVLLKNNVKAQWWRAMLQEREDIVALDSAIIQHPRPGRRAGTSPASPTRWSTAARASCASAPTTSTSRRAAQAVQAPGRDARLRPDRGARVQLDVRDDVGPVKEEGSTVYLRPETAQGIFLNFKNYLQFSRKKPPFGIAQIGKSFRNEITPGNFIFRTREFEQMEMEFFVPPTTRRGGSSTGSRSASTGTRTSGSAPTICACARTTQDELSHYSSATSDIEYLFPIGWSELEGIANRGDFDLRQHAEPSGQKLEYVDTASGDRYVPHVIEPAAGADRAMLAFLVDAYDEDEIEGEKRTVLRLHPQLAPVKVAVLPLVKKDGQPELAAEVYRELRERVQAEYDEGGAIGRRYRRQDEIGTPWAVTIDHQSLEDRTVTLRDRDSLAQDRIAIAELGGEIERRLRGAGARRSWVRGLAPRRPCATRGGRSITKLIRADDEHEQRDHPRDRDAGGDDQHERSDTTAIARSTHDGDPGPHSGSLRYIGRGRWRSTANTNRSAPGTQIVCARPPSARRSRRRPPRRSSRTAPACSPAVIRVRTNPGRTTSTRDAGRRARVGESLRERVEPGLGGAVDRVARRAGARRRRSRAR